MPKDRHYKYLLNVIDIFSKYLWSFPLTNMTADTVIEKIQSIFDTGQKPIEMRTDNGPSFIGSFYDFLTKNNVKLIYGTGYNSTSQAVVERVHQTIRNALRNPDTEHLRKNWANVLGDVVDGYNHEIHSTTKETPYDVHFGDRENIKNAYDNIIKRAKRLIEKTRSRVKINIGDKVRTILPDFKNAFQKRRLRQIWSDQVYTVQNIIHKDNGLWYKLEKNSRLYNINQIQKIPNVEATG